jgi:hypothetical protein
MAPEEKKEAALARLRETLDDLYGEEKKLIVLNRTPGVVSIGFGERGDQGGHAIARSRLPIVLTDIYGPDTWLKSSDFRRALTKQWLEIISKKEADAIWGEAQRRSEKLRQAAGTNVGHQPADVKITPIMDSTEPDSEPMVIDEETATLKRASDDEMTQQFMNYENFTPEPTAPPGITVISGEINSRALTIVENVRRGAMQPLDAITQIDEDAPLFTNEDLRFISEKASVDSVSAYASQLLAERSATS